MPFDVLKGYRSSILGSEIPGTGPIGSFVEAEMGELQSKLH